MKLSATYLISILAGVLILSSTACRQEARDQGTQAAGIHHSESTRGLAKGIETNLVNVDFEIQRLQSVIRVNQNTIAKLTRLMGERVESGASSTNVIALDETAIDRRDRLRQELRETSRKLKELEVRLEGCKFGTN
jgi:hypothetical protein